MPGLADPLRLPCGAILANRLAKGAMTEGLSAPDGAPTPELERLYRAWSHGGAGMLLTGNVQIDRDHLERPGNVIIDRAPTPEMKAKLQAWARAGVEGGNHFWMQISHAGRQTQVAVNPTPKAPSAVAVNLPGGRFGMPIPLSAAEIGGIVQRFATAARAAKEAGFTGVQVHAAHGYLISQFLSPSSNQRDDQWGGSLENRARLLLDVVGAVRAAVGPEFPVAVKLNSADFQKGGFAFEESLQVARWLEAAGVDLLEISGGTYEQPAMAGAIGPEQRAQQRVLRQAAESTQKREAYFVEFASAMRAQVKTMPLMVTGGFRSKAVMEQALESGAADVIGVGRPLCGAPEACKALLAGAVSELPRFEDRLALLPRWLAWAGKGRIMRVLTAARTINWYYAQLDNFARTGQVRLSQSVLSSSRQVARRHRDWLARRGR